MSTGQPIPLATAQALYEQLVALWSLDRQTCPVVGSVRRCKPEVHDLEIAAPAESKGHDTLCARITRTMEPEIMGGLFASPSAVADGRKAGAYIGRADKGLKPGFLTASLTLYPWRGIDDPTWRDREVAVQVNRYHPENKGWTILRSTGPGDFGKWFLWRWKQGWKIPDDKPASVEGRLVDANGIVVPTTTEEEAFRQGGVAFIQPEARDAFIQNLRAQRTGSMHFPE